MTQARRRAHALPPETLAGHKFAFKSEFTKMLNFNRGCVASASRLDGRGTYQALSSFLSRAEEKVMVDNGTRFTRTDREPVSRERQYEIRYFAERHTISPAQARQILQEAGSNRDKADAAAMRANRLRSGT